MSGTTYDTVYDESRPDHADFVFSINKARLDSILATHGCVNVVYNESWVQKNDQVRVGFVARGCEGGGQKVIEISGLASSSVAIPSECGSIYDVVSLDGDVVLMSNKDMVCRKERNNIVVMDNPYLMPDKDSMFVYSSIKGTHLPLFYINRGAITLLDLNRSAIVVSWGNRRWEDDIPVDLLRHIYDDVMHYSPIIGADTSVVYYPCGFRSLCGYAFGGGKEYHINADSISNEYELGEISSQSDVDGLDYYYDVSLYVIMYTDRGLYVYNNTGMD